MNDLIYKDYIIRQRWEWNYYVLNQKFVFRKEEYKKRKISIDFCKEYIDRLIYLKEIIHNSLSNFK